MIAIRCELPSRVSRAQCAPLPCTCFDCYWLICFLCLSDRKFPSPKILVFSPNLLMTNHNFCRYANSGLCFSSARWPVAPNVCSWATRKSQIFHTNRMLGTLDFTVSEHWAPFNFPQSTALQLITAIRWETLFQLKNVVPISIYNSNGI